MTERQHSPAGGGEADHVTVPRASTGKMWSAGRAAVAGPAEMIRTATNYEQAQAHVDRMPDLVWDAMLAAADVGPAPSADPDLETLAALDAAATQGEAHADMSGYRLRVGPPGNAFEGAFTTVAICSTCELARSNLVFLATLWNAYRSGALRPTTATPPAGAEARREEIAQLREEVAFWRRDLSARLWFAVGLYRSMVAAGNSGSAEQARLNLRAWVAAYEDAQAGEWHTRCEACGEFVRPSEPSAGNDDVSGHARCLSEDRQDDIAQPDTSELDLAARVADAKAVLSEEYPDAALATAPSVPERSFQERNVAWMRHVFFNAGDPTDLAERRDRFAEEALELIQATGGTLDGIIAQATYTFGREAGEPRQEAGGVMTTLACLATLAGFDLAEAGEAKLARCWRPEVIAKVQRKRANRHGRGVLPGDDADLVTSPPAPSVPKEVWRPIEQIKKLDQHPIQVCRMGVPEVCFGGRLLNGYAEPPETAWWCEYTQRWQFAQRPHDHCLPTHGRPLPAPPSPPASGPAQSGEERS